MTVRKKHFDVLKNGCPTPRYPTKTKIWRKGIPRIFPGILLAKTFGNKRFTQLDLYLSQLVFFCNQDFLASRSYPTLSPLPLWTFVMFFVPNWDNWGLWILEWQGSIGQNDCLDNARAVCPRSTPTARGLGLVADLCVFRLWRRFLRSNSILAKEVVKHFEKRIQMCQNVLRILQRVCGRIPLFCAGAVAKLLRYLCAPCLRKFARCDQGGHLQPDHG